MVSGLYGRPVELREGQTSGKSGSEMTRKEDTDRNLGIIFWNKFSVSEI